MSDTQLQGIPVWVYQKEIGTKKSLGMPKIIQGYQGDPYEITVPKIDGYSMDSVEGELSGHFSDTTQVITVYYRPTDVAQIEPMTGQFLHITAETQTYDQPDLSTAPRPTPLTADTDWPISVRLATTKGLFWHQIADSRWVLYDRRTMTIEKKARQSGINTPLYDWEAVAFSGAGQLVATAPDWPIKVYSKPYGGEIKTLPAELTVILTQVLHDPSGKDWYEIAGQGWIEGSNLKLTN
ncbi:MucBP domain-containing protein [Weissella diestrammenae]|uniref:MucBP domain-containing protein n=1 Tax=Weissella diestrammenae TaxID=1162633 RepID=A0A7G9T713_9LACO|nr:MucBP domain-containing protein [Weissella diestrammenae]MCM0582515.1 MucBP domain-containing protein [Weissella diestrammenae]QNN75888.1 MucBP domain-containing protein [Weissella diestrammenae]